jgi:hypothetical protein
VSSFSSTVSRLSSSSSLISPGEVGELVKMYPFFRRLFCSSWKKKELWKEQNSSEERVSQVFSDEQLFMRAFHWKRMILTIRILVFATSDQRHKSDMKFILLLHRKHSAQHLISRGGFLLLNTIKPCLGTRQKKNYHHPVVKRPNKNTSLPSRMNFRKYLW